jgi:hypothetical protein
MVQFSSLIHATVGFIKKVLVLEGLYHLLEKICKFCLQINFGWATVIFSLQKPESLATSALCHL